MSSFKPDNLVEIIVGTITGFGIWNEAKSSAWIAQRYALLSQQF